MTAREVAGTIARRSPEVSMAETAMRIERVGPDADPIVRNLYELYVHDMSEWFGLDVGPDGAFGHDTAPLWTGDHAVYLARMGDALAGFGVVGSAAQWLGDPAVRDVKDFFVLRRYRHRGVGDALAAHLWSAFPGPWLVRVLVANHPALSFWRRAVDRHASGRHQEHAVRQGERDWVHLRFDNAVP